MNNTNNKCECNCKSYKETPRQQEDIRRLKSRLNRISGQIGGISKMIDENRYCADILIQVAAAENALKSFGYIILKNHMETCVSEKIKTDDNEIIDETIEIIKKLN